MTPCSPVNTLLKNHLYLKECGWAQPSDLSGILRQLAKICCNVSNEGVKPGHHGVYKHLRHTFS